MSEKWIEANGWLAGYVKPKEENHEIMEHHAAIQTITRIKCPKCVSKRVKCYGKGPPKLYYRCLICKEKFIVIEKD